MGGFAFQVACLRLVAYEPLFGVYAVPVDWPVLRQNLRVVEVHMILRTCNLTTIACGRWSLVSN